MGDMRRVLTLTSFLAVILVACQSESGAAPASPTPQEPLPSPTRAATPILQGLDGDLATSGAELYRANCAACHGESGVGYANELQAPALNASEHASDHPDQQIHDWIVNGKLGFDRQMPPLGAQLTDAQVHAVIAYLHTLWTEDQLAIQQDISRRWPATPEPTWTPSP